MSDRAIRSLAALFAIAAIAFAAASSATAHADGRGPADQQAAQAPSDRPHEDYVVDAEYGPNGSLKDVRAFLADGTEIPVPSEDRSKVPARLRPLAGKPGGGATTNATGGGGAPGGTQGCRWITVNNEVETLLGFTLVWTHTYTSWCWSTITGAITSPVPDFWFSSLDPFWGWVGLIRNVTSYFSYHAGFPQSGYVHDKQAHFNQCQFGACQNVYPRTEFKAYYDGSYTWTTWD